MKNSLTFKFGKLLMRFSPLKICIIDDVATYFNEDMLKLAKVNMNIKFERLYSINTSKLASLVKSPPDIFILDIKGIVENDVGKDGFDIAKHLSENTPSFIVITSAHQFHLKNRKHYGDYTLTERLLTPIDFAEELNLIIKTYLEEKLKFYKKIFFKMGFKIVKHSTVPVSSS
jgi:hypothetical protein